MTDVSVVIPVYNVEKWLPACLESVLAQTLENIDIVCVNDCSPDNSASILEDYAARDSRIRVINLQQNSGQGIARNVGFNACEGRYVYFLDSDDMVAPTALEELFACAESNNLEGIFFDSEVVFDNPQLAKRHKSYPACHTGVYDLGVQEGLKLFEAFVFQYDWTCYVQRQFWRTSYLRENGISFPNWSPHEDESFAFEALVRAQRVMYLPRPFFIRRYREGSAMTSKMGMRNLRSYIQALTHMLELSYQLELRSDAVLSNNGRIFFACKRIHEQLTREGIDPAEHFLNDAELRNKYLVFGASQNYYLHYGLLTPYTLEQISQARTIYIYGAGTIASDVFDKLAVTGYAIEGFLVTSLQGNPTAFKGHHVLALEDVTLDPDALVVVAVTDGYRAEVEQALDEAGWKHVYFKERAHDER